MDDGSPEREGRPDRPYDPELADRILRALRRVSRAIDLHSRRLASDHRLTGPQLVCLRHVAAHGPLPPGQLARLVSLSHATVTGILQRLELRGLVQRTPDDVDRRRVQVTLTEAGRGVVDAAPYPLQERFLRELAQLPHANQSIIATVLDQIVDMMHAEALDASPLLTTGPIDAAPEDVERLIKTLPASAPD